MLNLESFVANLARLINGSHFRADCKVEGSDNQIKYYLKLSTSDKDYKLYRFELDGKDLDIFVVKEVEFLGANEELLTSVKLEDIFDGDTIITDSIRYNKVTAYIIKSVMVHYAFSKAGKYIALPFSTPSSFSFKLDEVGSEVMTSLANSILRNTKQSTLRDSVLPNSFWVNVGDVDGVLLHQVGDKVAVLVFNIGYDGKTGSTSYKYIYHGVYDAHDTTSLNELVGKVADICY